MNLSSVAQCSLFHAVSEKEIDKILSELNIKERLFKKGEVLALQDEPCNRLIILLKGSVKAEMIDYAGRVMKVEDIHAPNPLAILFLFGENNRFPVQASANEEVTALVIPRQSVLKMLMMNETLLVNYLDLCSTFATRLSRKLNFMSFRTIRQKLALYILQLSKAQQSDHVILDKPKAGLADYFGVSRPALERELTRMQHEGMIESGRKNITITDKAALRNTLN